MADPQADLRFVRVVFTIKVSLVGIHYELMGDKHHLREHLHLIVPPNAHPLNTHQNRDVLVT